MSRDFLLPSFPSLVNCDFIGTESCFDLLEGNNQHRVQPCTSNSSCCTTTATPTTSSNRYTKRSDTRHNNKVEKEFPPPIPLLARTQNLPPRMPWILKRHYTRDGRLVLTEEKVRHHEYFRVHRADGRLTLLLIPLDHHDINDPNSPPSPFVHPWEDDHELFETELEEENSSIDECETEEYISDGDHEHNKKKGMININDEDDGDGDGDVDNSFSELELGNGGTPKCLTFNSMASGSSCIFGIPAPEFQKILSSSSPAVQLPHHFCFHNSQQQPLSIADHSYPPS